MPWFMRAISGIAQRGPTRAIQGAISAVEDVLFDFRLGLDTSDNVNVEELQIDEADRQHSHKYQPTRIRYFRKLMDALQLPAELVLVDVGCGKGRIMMAAAECFSRGSGASSTAPASLMYTATNRRPPSKQQAARRNVAASSMRSRSSSTTSTGC